MNLRVRDPIERPSLLGSRSKGYCPREEPDALPVRSFGAQALGAFALAAMAVGALFYASSNPATMAANDLVHNGRPTLNPPFAQPDFALFNVDQSGAFGPILLHWL